MITSPLELLLFHDDEEVDDVEDVCGCDSGASRTTLAR